MEKVSVIIPTYNRADRLKRAILSVLNQSYSYLEVIVVDDCSPDDTKAVVSSFRDERIRYIRHEQNKGGSATRNTGIKNASGKFIALLDDDDEWLPTKLEKQIEKFREVSGNVGIIYTGYVAIDEKDGSQRLTRIPTKRGDIFKDQLFSNVPLNSSVLIRKEVFDRYGSFDERLPSCQEWELYIRFSKAVEFDFVPEILVSIYHHWNRISTNIQSKINGLKIVLDKHLNEFSQFPHILSGHYYLLGFYYALDRDHRNARKNFLQALKRNPLNLRLYGHLLFSWLLPDFHSRELNKRRHII